ncbi:MAG: ATP-binding cassette domain-containing protein [Bdellovibrionota bacterium]
MAQHKPNNLDHIFFENVSYQNEGLDPVLVHVDLELPMDQTIIIQSSNPAHSVHVLEILAGRKEPQSGKIKWTDQGAYGGEESQVSVYELVASYFESSRPDPNVLVQDLLSGTGATAKIIAEAVEHFELNKLTNKAFKSLSYETQKLVLLIIPTLSTPQMLILEDPAVGLSQEIFLNYLDWIQIWQRQGHLRHIYLTNNHPAAARHLEANIMYVEDGLIYLEENQGLKKIVHF